MEHPMAAQKMAPKILPMEAKETSVMVPEMTEVMDIQMEVKRKILAVIQGNSIAA